MFRVTLEGEADLARDWNESMRVVSRGIGRGVRRGCEEAIASFRTSHRYTDRTGELTRTAYGRLLVETNGGASGEMVWPAKYASFVEEGTGPHDIWPKEGHGFVGPLMSGQSRRKLSDVGTHRVALRWYGPSGKPIFARMVHHPGNRAFGFAGDAFLACERVVIREVEASYPEAQRALAA